MTPEKVLEVIGIYRRWFEKQRIEKRDFSHEEVPTRADFQLAHCHGMLDKMEGFVRDGNLHKACCWLGFVQGVLWANEIHTLAQLRDHNCSAEYNQDEADRFCEEFQREAERAIEQQIEADSIE